jgi:hypothetical protein
LHHIQLQITASTLYYNFPFVSLLSFESYLKIEFFYSFSSFVIFQQFTIQTFDIDSLQQNCLNLEGLLKRDIYYYIDGLNLFS